MVPECRAVESLIAEFASSLGVEVKLREQVSLVPYTTLQAGGRARWLLEVRNTSEFASAAAKAQELGLKVLILGSGSNVLPSENGVDELVLVNLCRRVEIRGTTYAETGAAFQDVFLKCAQAGLTGLEFAVGIPGTLGGALVSNAGAYRSNLSECLSEVEIVQDAERKWVPPAHLEFKYRDSVLRRPNPPAIALLAVRLDLKRDAPRAIYERARDYQRQRIGKQPPQASAGSFFKNVLDKSLARSLDGLSVSMQEAGVVPAGYLIEACGLKGYRIGRAVISTKHANFICNLGGATATHIRQLAEEAKRRVQDRFGVTLEEEVLYIGNWGAQE